jgi:putative Holliday junction resolvase
MDAGEYSNASTRDSGLGTRDSIRDSVFNSKLATMTDSGTNPESRTQNPDLWPIAILACVRALGIDYGRRRIGLALSDATGMLARPWKTIAGGGGPARVATLLAAEIVLLSAESDGLSAVAFGYPRRLNGEPTEQTAAVEQIVARLRTVVELPIVLQDERLSSREAESLLARREKDWRKRKVLLDAASAAIILQDYLDGQARARRHESGIEEDE